MAEKEIIGFLMRCLDEDEVIACATRQASLSWQNFDMDGELRDSVNAGTVAHVPAEEDRVHIARHDPAQVLLEVAAKRAVLTHCTAMLAWAVPGSAVAQLCINVLVSLAPPYMYREGYNPAWRKDG